MCLGGTYGLISGLRPKWGVTRDQNDVDDVGQKIGRRYERDMDTNETLLVLDFFFEEWIP